MQDTIYALSSGLPPAAIAIIRISGPKAGAALIALSGSLPEPRYATYAMLKAPKSNELIDRALILWFPGPNSATGEDVAELHLHGGRSIVAAISAILDEIEGLRAAQPGEFTRRAFENGRIDLAEAEGLADLLMAETEAQRRAALRLAGGKLSQRIEDWQRHILKTSADIEAMLDFSDETEDGEPQQASWRTTLSPLIRDIETILSKPAAERLRDGIRVVIGGPPNAGKSSLFNYLIDRRAAITSPKAGTTRDSVEAPIMLGGLPFVLIDTAGLHENSTDDIEAIGIDLAKNNLAAADIILWLGAPDDCPGPERTILIESKCDLGSAPQFSGCDIRVSSRTGENMDRLVMLLTDRGRTLLPQEGDVALNARHRALVMACLEHLNEAIASLDPLVAAEELRQARNGLDQVTGKAGVEDMLDALFSRFCIGK